MGRRQRRGRGAGLGIPAGERWDSMSFNVPADLKAATYICFMLQRKITNFRIKNSIENCITFIQKEEA